MDNMKNQAYGALKPSSHMPFIFASVQILLSPFLFFPLPCYLSFSLSTMFSTILPLVFFCQLGFSLNSC